MSADPKLDSYAPPPAQTHEPAAVEHSDEDRQLDDLLKRVDLTGEASLAQAQEQPQREFVPQPMCVAVIQALSGRRATVQPLGAAPIEAKLAANVDEQLIARAKRYGDSVLLQCAPDETPVIVGVVQTRIPSELELKASTIRIDADQELLLRSGRAAVRLRQDGDVELVGSRISALSRGLFRLVGRVLRLN